MGNCLVTKLKGVVDNPDLLKLGELRIDVTGNTAFGIGYSACTATIISGPGNFYTDGDVLIGKVLQGGTFAYIKDVTEKTTVSIISKYDLQALEGYPGKPEYALENVTLDLDVFKYCPLLRHIKLRNSTVYGDTSVLKGFNLSTLQIVLCSGSVKSSLLDFANTLNLSSLLLQTGAVQFDQMEAFERLIEAQFANGRQSGGLSVSVFNRKFTLHDIVIKDGQATFSANGVSVTGNLFDNTSFSASYDGTSWIYNN